MRVRLPWIITLFIIIFTTGFTLYADEKVTIRWGAVIKLIPRSGYEHKIDEIYDDVMQKTKGVTKIKDGLTINQEFLQKTRDAEEWISNIPPF